jgi:hypothetical protein
VRKLTRQIGPASDIQQDLNSFQAAAFEKLEGINSLLLDRDPRMPEGIGGPELGNYGIGSMNLPVNITLEFRQPFVRGQSYNIPHSYESFKYTVQVGSRNLLSRRVR